MLVPSTPEMSIGRMLTCDRRLLPSSGLLVLPVKRASEFLFRVRGTRNRFTDTTPFEQMDQRLEQHLLHVLDPHLRLHT